MAFEIKISLLNFYGTSWKISEWLLHFIYSFYNFDLLIFQSMGLRLHNPQKRVLDNVSVWSSVFSIGSCTHYAPDCRSRTQSLANSASYGIDYQRLTGVYYIHTDGFGIYDRHYGSYALRRTVRRFVVSTSTRWDDGSLSMGNNPMVGATVAIAVAIQQAMN